MRTIYKYALDMDGNEIVDVPDVPFDADLLDVQFQAVYDKWQDTGEVALFAWFLIPNTDTIGTPGHPTVTRRFVVATTGNPYPIGAPSTRYIRTLQRNGIVLHIFDGGVV